MSQPRAKFLYKYEEEPFSVRRKEFWPLAESGKVLDSLIPKLCHEADGLILQVCILSCRCHCCCCSAMQVSLGQPRGQTASFYCCMAACLHGTESDRAKTLIMRAGIRRGVCERHLP